MEITEREHLLDILELADSGSALELGDAQERLEAVEQYIFQIIPLDKARELIIARKADSRGK